MEVQKSFVTLDNTATITCPQCHKSKTVPVAQYRNKKHNIKVNCSCNHCFATLLDFRRHYRKDTNLEGTYAMLPPAVGAGKLHILNISRSGVGATLGFSVTSNHAIQVGQKAKITFQLDNRKQTTIEKTVTICSINDQLIGCEFDDIKALEKDLGFYLQP